MHTGKNDTMISFTERNFRKYGAEWPEEVYMVSKGAGR